MLLQSACAGIQHAPRCHDLDDVDTRRRELTNRLLALFRAGADRRIEVRLIHRLRHFGRQARRRRRRGRR